MWHLSQTKKTNLQLFVVSFYHYSGKHDYVLASWFSQLDWPSVFDGFAPILLYGVYSQLLHHPMYSIQFCPYHHCCWCHQGMIKDYVQHTVLPLPPPLLVPSTYIYMYVSLCIHAWVHYVNKLFYEWQLLLQILWENICNILAYKKIIFGIYEFISET